MTTPRIYTMSFASVYPLYVAKAEKKGRTKAEVDTIITWLTGYTTQGLKTVLKNETDFQTFYKQAPRPNPARKLIKGVVCGIRVEEIKEPVMREIRYLDKLIDELARGKAMERILRSTESQPAPQTKAAYTTIPAYNRAQTSADKKICTTLMKDIVKGLPKAEGKIWHAHPVWFLDGNPIVGYGKLKGCIRLMFWSGASFNELHLTPGTGKFKDASISYIDASEINKKDLQRWLKKARTIQWDYKNVYKRKGKLVKL